MATCPTSHEEQQPPLSAVPAVLQAGHNTDQGPTLYHVLPEGTILAFPEVLSTSQQQQQQQNFVLDKFSLVLPAEDREPLEAAQYILALAYEEDGTQQQESEVDKPLHIHVEPPPSPDPAPSQPDTNSPSAVAPDPEEVAIDVSKPIELAQNSVIVVNGQKCVLQQDPTSGKVVAYPVRPRRRRGRPRKTEAKTKTPPTIPVQEDQNEEELEESLPEIPGEKGMMEVSTEEGARVKRSCRRRKKSNVLKDYETGGQLGSDGESSDQASSKQPDEEALFPYRKRKITKIPGRRGPGRPSLSSKDQPKTFIIQVESSSGQVLHIKLQARALPDNATLQAHLAKLGIKSNKIFPVPHPIAPAAPPQPAAEEVTPRAEPSLEATSLIPVSAKRKPGRPRKYPLPAASVPAVTTTKPTFITLTSEPAPEEASSPPAVLLAPPDTASTTTRPEEPVVAFDPNLIATSDSHLGASYEQSAPIFCSPDDPGAISQNPTFSSHPGLLAAEEKQDPAASDPSPADLMLNDSTHVVDYGGENVSLLISEPATSLELTPQEQPANPVADIPSSALDPLINSSVGTCLFLTEDMSLSLATEPLFAEVNKTPTDQQPEVVAWKDFKNEAEVQLCPLCEFHSASRPYFQQHLKACHPDNFLKCDLAAGCKFSALTQEEMDLHAKEVHQHCICSECGFEEYSPSLMKKHMEKHTSKLFTCDICSKNYKDQYVLRMHRKLVHEPASTLYKCSVCSKSFNRKAHLKRHQRIHNPAKPFKCDYCDYRGCDRSVLKKHLLIHQEPKHTCEICGRTFRHLPNWHLHLKRHKGQRDYKCGACNFFGYTLTDIKKHIERRHKDVGASVCQQCTSVFNTPAELQEHAASCGGNDAVICIKNTEDKEEAVTISLSDLDLLMGKPSTNIIMVNQDGTVLDGGQQQFVFNVVATQADAQVAAVETSSEQVAAIVETSPEQLAAIVEDTTSS